MYSLHFLQIHRLVGPKWFGTLPEAIQWCYDNTWQKLAKELLNKDDDEKYFMHVALSMFYIYMTLYVSPTTWSYNIRAQNNFRIVLKHNDWLKKFKFLRS